MPRTVTSQAEEVEVARAFADAAAAGLAQLQLAAEHATQTARQAALARAARTLNESLDLNRVLVRICQEAAGILGVRLRRTCTSATPRTGCASRPPTACRRR